MENVNAGALEVCCFDWQKVLERCQCVDAGFVDISDFQRFFVCHHHINGHLIQHAEQPVGFLFFQNPICHHAPGERWTKIFATG